MSKSESRKIVVLLIDKKKSKLKSTVYSSVLRTKIRLTVTSRPETKETYTGISRTTYNSSHTFTCFFTPDTSFTLLMKPFRKYANGLVVGNLGFPVTKYTRELYFIIRSLLNPNSIFEVLQFPSLKRGEFPHDCSFRSST